MVANFIHVFRHAEKLKLLRMLHLVRAKWRGVNVYVCNGGISERGELEEQEQ